MRNEINCIRCKGRELCRRESCPFKEAFSRIRTIRLEKTVDAITPPSIFVGRFGYPKVSVGPLGVQEENIMLETPEKWISADIPEFLSSRISMIHGRTLRDVRERDRVVESIQEIAMSTRPNEVEMRFEKEPRVREIFDDIVAPIGVAGEVRVLRVLDNPKIPKKVDELLEENMRAEIWVRELYESGFSNYYIEQILSSGVAGSEKRRRLVPTRWAITATDDILGRFLIERIRRYPEINEIRVFSGEAMGNHFEIILLPGRFYFELMEIWMPRDWISETVVEVDREDERGKKEYSSLSGGYYAARLPVLEYLEGERRCASIVAIREIRPSYWAPLGVWVVREAARKTMRGEFRKFESLKEALEDVKRRVMTPEWLWIKKIEFLKQKSLFDFS
ncbi:MAG: repair protein NreA [Archaeoglobi archaeon]|nr:repair protein NreA [Archaeoglobi archaeon]